MSRCGTAAEHCCWFQGEACQYIEQSDRPDFVWDCRLRKDYGSWEAVHLSPEYLTNVKPKMIELGYAIDCGDWPPPGVVCNDCGEGA